MRSERCKNTRRRHIKPKKLNRHKDSEEEDADMYGLYLIFNISGYMKVCMKRCRNKFEVCTSC